MPEKSLLDKPLVLIPAAKIVPEELQNIGKLPAVIYPVNQRIMFDYLWDQYSESCGRIIVVCFEQAIKVHRRLSGYDRNIIRIVELAELRDLGYTVYCGLIGAKGQAVINFADTIVMDRIQDTDSDCFFYAEDEVTEKWTYFEEQGGVITHILDKTKEKVSGCRPLFVGVFRVSDAVCFCKCLEEAFSQQDLGMNTFYYALMLYSRIHPMKPVRTDNWFDIGHIDKYSRTQIEVKAREFNHISVDKDRGILKKTSDDKEKFIGEILWYLKLPTDVEYVRPRIFSYSVDYNNPYVVMEYYAYHTIHELFLYGDLTGSQWRCIFSRIQFVCNDFKRYSSRDEKNICASLKDIYLNKTISRLEKLKEKTEFLEFFKQDIEVNGCRYDSLDVIIKKLKDSIPMMLFDVDEFHIIHGDLCFANIMVDSNYSFIKMIDPRGKFGSFDIYGDSRYELAKLFHSVDGKYDFIIKDLFSIDFDTETCRIEFHIHDRVREYDLYSLFCEVFRNEIGEDLKKIELIESLLFLSMIPLHGESLRHQMAMLATGLEILGRVIGVRKDDRD